MLEQWKMDFKLEMCRWKSLLGNFHSSKFLLRLWKIRHTNAWQAITIISSHIYSRPCGIASLTLSSRRERSIDFIFVIDSLKITHIASFQQNAVFAGYWSANAKIFHMHTYTWIIRKLINPDGKYAPHLHRSRIRRSRDTMRFCDLILGSAMNTSKQSIGLH